MKSVVAFRHKTIIQADHSACLGEIYTGPEEVHAKVQPTFVNLMN